ncbi:MAG: hypothetical protein K2Y18_08795 [Alphaproteobacteria bacterium]|jgi:hypothetical protein|nr:hypothetical protein [Alphaproteobacteria bacterium]
MKYLSKIIAYAILTLSPVLAAEKLDVPYDPDGKVNYSGLPLTDVILGLWNNAVGTTDTDLAQRCFDSFILAQHAPNMITLPSREEARGVVEAGSNHIDHFKGRTLKLYIIGNETLDCLSYNSMHGPLRAQKVISALLDLSRKHTIIPLESLRQCYIDNVWAHVKAQERENAEKLRIQGKNEKADELLRSHDGIRNDTEFVAFSYARTGDVATSVSLAIGIRDYYQSRSKTKPKAVPKSAPAKSASAAQAVAPKRTAAKSPQRRQGAGSSSFAANLQRAWSGK